MAPGADGIVSALTCKRCNRKVINGIKCQKCSSTFHSSCAKLYNNVKQSDDKTFIICCESESVVNSEPDAAFYDALEDLANSDKKVDIHLFSYIIKQKDIIINELREKINLLHKQIEIMNIYSDIKSEREQKPNKTDLNTKSDFCKSIQTPEVVKTCSKIKTTNKEKELGRSHLSCKQISADLMKIQTQLKCNEIINLAKDEQKEPPASCSNENPMQNADGEWKQVHHNRRRKTIIGKNKEISVKGVPKMAVLHVYRVDLNTTTADLSALLKDTFPEVTCEYLTPKHPDLYVSFKVSIYEENFRNAMNPDVWPAGACVSRFFQFRKSTTVNQ